MAERSVQLTTEFRVRQIAGSCRMESINVTKDDEKLMAQILDGVVDGAAYRRELTRKFKEANAKLASGS